MPLNDDLCDACGYHLILRKVLDTEGVARRNDSTGLERVMKKQLSRGETPENTLFWAQLVAGCLLLLVCSMCLGIYGLFLAGAAIAAYVVYRLATRASGRLPAGLSTRIPWWCSCGQRSCFCSGPSAGGCWSGPFPRSAC